MKKKFSIKFHLISAGSLAVVGLILSFVFPNIFNKPTALLVVDYGGGTTRTFSGEVIEQMTILDTLSASAEGAALQFEYNQENDAALLLVEGRSNQIKIKLNNRPVSINMISQTLIGKGDLVEIQLHE